VADIIIYSKSFCPYCVLAKELLEKKKLEFEIIDIVENSDKREEMIERSNGKMTVPQIFIKDKHIGGFDKLKELDEKGELDNRMIIGVFR
jgi:glutaredoxin 3